MMIAGKSVELFTLKYNTLAVFYPVLSQELEIFDALLIFEVVDILDPLQTTLSL